MKIIRVLPGVYNEIDILEENLRYYIDQGFETVVVDNGSTDGSFELCQKYLGKGIIKLAQIITKEFDTRLLLKEATLLYKEVNPDWIILADADEFIEPFEPQIGLREAIEQADKKEFTLIPMYHFMFKITERDNCKIKNIQQRMKYYGKANDADRYKIWKDSRHVEIFGPHSPNFLDKSKLKIAPNAFVMMHYPFRSLLQAEAKMERVKPSPNNPFGWNTHYLGKTKEDILSSSKDLNEYKDDRDWKFDKTIDSDNANDSDRLKFYLNEGKEYAEKYIEQIKEHNSTWKNNPVILKNIGDIYCVNKENDKATQYYSQARDSALNIIKEIENMFE